MLNECVVRARCTEANKVRASGAVVRARDTIIIAVIIGAVRTLNSQRNTSAAGESLFRRAPALAYLLALELPGNMPVGAERGVVLQLHTRIVTNIAKAGDRVATFAMLLAGQTIILPVVIKSFPTVRVLGTQLGLLVHEVVGAFTGTPAVLNLERRIDAGQAKTCGARAGRAVCGAVFALASRDKLICFADNT